MVNSVLLFKGGGDCLVLQNMFEKISHTVYIAMILSEVFNISRFTW